MSTDTLNQRLADAGYTTRPKGDGKKLILCGGEVVAGPFRALECSHWMDDHAATIGNRYHHPTVGAIEIVGVGPAEEYGPGVYLFKAVASQPWWTGWRGNIHADSLRHLARAEEAT